jgi:hypothetical protein
MIICPECKVANDAHNARCWICARPLSADEPIDAVLVASPRSPPQFGLSTMLLGVTLICVCLGVATVAPGMIVPLLVIAIPAMVRAISATSQMKREGQEVTFSDRLSAFASSFAVVAAAWFAGAMVWVAGLVALGIALFAVCVTAMGGNRAPQVDNSLMVIGAVLGVGGVIAGFVLFVVMLIRTWPTRK